jgi:hypothetical protein
LVTNDPRDPLYLFSRQTFSVVDLNQHWQSRSLVVAHEWRKSGGDQTIRKYLITAAALSAVFIRDRNVKGAAL